ncbi:MAG: MTH1187 family thiamine-binding protein [Salinivirgaceae bacterium]
MAVLMEFAIFPTDQGISVSQQVTQVIEMIKESGYPFQLTAMGTLIETPTVGEALEIVEKAATLLQEESKRIYSTIKLDIKKDAANLMETKVQSVMNKLNKDK